MASFFTNRGKYMMLGHSFNGVTTPTNYYAYLINSGTPTVDTNTWSDLSAGASTNIATNPVSLTPNSTDFPTITEDDTSDFATVAIKDIVFTASGGDMSGTWCIITDDNVTPASRQVVACLDFGGTETVSDTQTLTVSSTTLKIT